MGESISLYEIIRSLTIVDYAVILLSLVVGLICFAGIIFAVFRRKQHNFVSIITIILFLLMTVNFVIVPVARIYADNYLKKSVWRDDTKENEIPNDDKRPIFSDKATKLIMYQSSASSVISTVELVIQIVLVILILIAIFQGRGKVNPPLSSVQNC